MIVAADKPRELGTYTAWDPRQGRQQPYCVLREATYEEWLEDMASKIADGLVSYEMAMSNKHDIEAAPDKWHFYEVSVD